MYDQSTTVSTSEHTSSAHRGITLETYHVACMIGLEETDTENDIRLGKENLEPIVKILGPKQGQEIFGR